MKDETIAFVGAGNMGEALMRGLLAGKVVSPAQVIAHDVRPERLEQLARQLGVRTSATVPAAEIVVLAVKPQQMSEVLRHGRETIANSRLVISIAAGITTGRIERELGGKPRVVRAMPNTPALVGAGMAGLCRGAFATDDDLATAEKILRAVGETVRVPESLMDAVTAVSGSGPAYVFLVAEALTQAGIEAGLPAEVAAKLAVQTVVGAGKLLAETGTAPAELRRQVTSPGGTTEAAIKVLTEQGLPATFVAAVAAAKRRGAELAGEKRD